MEKQKLPLVGGGQGKRGQEIQDGILCWVMLFFVVLAAFVIKAFASR